MVDADEKSFEMEDTASFVEQELEALKSIYISEIEVKQDEKNLTSVSIDLYPATADNLDEQYVRMTLKFILNDEYPQVVPEISIRNPRGLSEEKLNSIMQDLSSIAESKIGCSMLFEIIEAAKEHLTNENRPCGECAICLYGFSEDDVFTKTDCYHYFHSHCLARYVKNAANAESSNEDGQNDIPPNKEVLCPMCRLQICFEGTEELYPPPSTKDDEFVIDEEILALQKRMADLYQKQLNKGGIINIEAEKNKYLLEISNVPTRIGTVEKSSPGSTVDDSDSIPEADFSSKLDENTCGDSQSPPKNKSPGSKDSRTDFRNKDKSDRRQRSDRYGYSKQPRNNNSHYNSYRGNQKFNRYSKPNSQNFNRKSNNTFAAEELDYDDEQCFDDEDSSPKNKSKGAVEDNSAESYDASPVLESSRGFRSSNTQRKSGRVNYSDSKRYTSERQGNDYRPNSNRGRRYAPNSYEKHSYRGNQRESKSSPNTNDSTDKGDRQSDAINDIHVSDSNALDNSAESVSERPVSTTTQLTEKQDNENKMQQNRPRNFNVQNRKNYRNPDSDTNHFEDNAYGQEDRKDSYRRGKSGRGYRNNYNDRQSYRENGYHSQGNRYSQENGYKRNFNQHSRQGERHSQEKDSYNYEERRDYDKNRSDGRPAREASSTKFSSDGRYEWHERENNLQGNISKKSSYKNYGEEQLDDMESNYVEKGNRYNGRNRNNSHYQNKEQNSRGNRNFHRFSNDSSYQNNKNTSRRNIPRKYIDNSDSHYCKGDERTKPDFQVTPESSDFVNNKPSVSEKVSAPKTDIDGCLASEIPCKESQLPDVKTPASDSASVVMPQKTVLPPPGFSNPLKRVVYGLQAANPPPGFPRS